MKKILSLGLIISLIILSCSQQKSRFPQGAWKLVYSQGTETDSLGNVKAIDYHPTSVQIWSEKNFAFIGQWKQDTVIRDFYGGGTYTLNGNHCEAKVMYHWSQPRTVLDWTLKLLLEQRNDTMIFTYPLNDNWEIDKKNYYVEKYIQLK